MRDVGPQLRSIQPTKCDFTQNFPGQRKLSESVHLNNAVFMPKFDANVVNLCAQCCKQNMFFSMRRAHNERVAFLVTGQRKNKSLSIDAANGKQGEILFAASFYMEVKMHRYAWGIG